MIGTLNGGLAAHDNLSSARGLDGDRCWLLLLCGDYGRFRQKEVVPKEARTTRRPCGRPGGRVPVLTRHIDLLPRVPHVGGMESWPCSLVELRRESAEAVTFAGRIDPP